MKEAEEESWKPRSFIDIDNHSAVDVGHLRRGHKAFSCPEAEFQ